HSNLDDGFGSQYHDLANLVGWAMIERYIVEDLLGAGLGHCFGNLFSDPMLRIIFNCAMGKINKHHTAGSMIYGNTIDFGVDFARNFGAMASFSMADAIGQMKYGSGHAICPIPVTEATRIPSADEIIEAHRLVDIMIEKAPMYGSFIDWEKVEAEADILVVCGRIFSERVLNSLDDMKVDITHPGELLSVLKAIGPEQLETDFGVGQKDKYAMRGRIPVRPTSIIQTISEKEQTIIERMDSLEEKPLKGIKVVMGTTDVHEFGKEICKSIIQKAGATVFDMGATVAPAELIDTMIETESNILLVSTYNGIALSYAKEVLDGFQKNNISAKLIMGGLINENMDGSDLPVDVTKEVQALGVNCDNKAEELVNIILKIGNEFKQQA
ncbi:MAG: methylmalonyl-CoA mutase, partial [Angelakisella sp.]